ncbi:hypothetical protein PI126_g18823 [Phytophthora idaei]|nr:hypothetical protein PI126_g18823 [Phytophthora idaei]
MDARLQGAQFKGGAKATNARNGFTVTGPDQGDGKQVFTLLRKYLREDAPDEYILHTVLRLMDLAKERRFKAHHVTMGEGQLPPEVELDIRTQWKDEPTQTQNERYKGLLSYWDCRNAEHVRRMHKLMAEWVLADNLPQGELEVRTQQFTFVNVPRQEDKEPHNEEHRTYKEAVDSGPRRPINWMEDKPELQQLYELCMQPAAVLTQLRQRTTEEYRALLMILNHELEVLFPPRFLVQTMAAKEMARFTDIFMNLEYPLYAHLAPGQRFGVSMSKDAIMAEIHMGEEEAYPQRQEIEEFKAAVARLVINMDTRILTATFKGRKSAQRWVNWRVPLGMRMLTLIDYEKEREEAKVTHELVKMDCYSFTITLRKGDLTSSDVHWLMTEKIGLQVQTLAHPEMNTRKDARTHCGPWTLFESRQWSWFSTNMRYT